MSARVLVTNDDGISAPGLRALAGVAREAGFEVVVAAPRAEESGMSAALTAVTEGGRIVVAQQPEGLAVAASPAYIVVLASIGAFGPPPDLVLSGINRGANAGRAVLHSGTVGAALTAANHGMRAMAVSLDVLTTSPPGPEIVVPADADLHWDTAAAVARDLLAQVEETPPGTVLNVNAPDISEISGVKWVDLAQIGQTQMAVAESGEGFVRTTFQRGTEPLVDGTDLAALAAGYATVTLLRPPAALPAPRLPAQRPSRD
jgi:5'-nucleotidase